MTGRTDDTAPPPRRRGRPATIDRARIIAAARRLDPRALTMKAVADDLGVDPTTLNYHVLGRDGLLQLLAADSFERSFSAADVVAGADWRSTVRTFAIAIHDAIVATGALALHFRFDSDLDFAALEPFELTLTALLDAGFELMDAAHILSLVGELADAAARRVVNRTEPDVAAQDRQLRESLRSGSHGKLASLRKLAERDPAVDVHAQFEFDLQVILLGLERLRAERS